MVLQSGVEPETKPSQGSVMSISPPERIFIGMSTYKDYFNTLLDDGIRLDPTDPEKLWTTFKTDGPKDVIDVANPYNRIYVKNGIKVYSPFIFKTAQEYAELNGIDVKDAKKIIDAVRFTLKQQSNRTLKDISSSLKDLVKLMFEGVDMFQSKVGRLDKFTFIITAPSSSGMNDWLSTALVSRGSLRESHKLDVWNKDEAPLDKSAPFDERPSLSFNVPTISHPEILAMLNKSGTAAAQWKENDGSISTVHIRKQSNGSYHVITNSVNLPASLNIDNILEPVILSHMMAKELCKNIQLDKDILMREKSPKTAPYVHRLYNQLLAKADQPYAVKMVSARTRRYFKNFIKMSMDSKWGPILSLIPQSKILMLDDTLGEGVTIKEMARILSEAGAKDVMAFALFRDY